MALVAVNPATGEVENGYEEMDAKTIRQRIEASHQAYQIWRNTDMPERAKCLRRTAQVLESEKEVHAALMAREMGKPIRDGRAEIDKCAWVCRYYADHAPEMLKPEPVDTDAEKSYVVFPPLGVVLAIMPWNYPFWQVFRFAAPALMAGNAALLKHASNVPGCALAVEGVMQTAGLPPALFQNLLIPGEAVQKVIDHPSVKAVTLTGSKPTGQDVAARAQLRTTSRRTRDVMLVSTS